MDCIRPAVAIEWDVESSYAYIVLKEFPAYVHTYDYA